MISAGKVEFLQSGIFCGNTRWIGYEGYYIEKLQLESDFEKISLGGVISYINILKTNWYHLKI